MPLQTTSFVKQSQQLVRAASPRLCTPNVAQLHEIERILHQEVQDGIAMALHPRALQAALQKPYDDFKETCLTNFELSSGRNSLKPSTQISRANPQTKKAPPKSTKIFVDAYPNSWKTWSPSLLTYVAAVAPEYLDQAIVPWIVSWIWQIFISSISRIRPSQQQRVLPMQLPEKNHVSTNTHTLNIWMWIPGGTTRYIYIYSNLLKWIKKNSQEYL